jgi:tetratricopeptide (TPR) repeat protein
MIDDREARLNDVLLSYAEAVEAGQAPDRQTLLARHPEFADELREFFAGQDQIHRLAAPLRLARASDEWRTGASAQLTVDEDRPPRQGQPSAPEPNTAPAGPDEEGAEDSLAETKDCVRRPVPDLPAVPGYELMKELGRGGMGVVYLARQVGLNRLVALKVIRAGARADPEQLARFRIEAEAVAQLQHPNIVQIHEIGDHDGLPYFSLEYAEGGSLAVMLARSPQPPRFAAELVVALARAMHAAHKRGIVHRDLKPANVLLAAPSSGVEPARLRPADFIPKITDFGLAKRLEVEGETQSGVVVGTPTYMAPEQAGGKSRHIGPAADIYALGVILYEMLTGRPPFAESALMAILTEVLMAEPVPPSRLQGGVPRDLETICLKCLQKEPHRRYATAAALADDLRRFLNHEPIQARRTPAAVRLGKWARRRPAVALLAVVSPLALVFLLGALFFHQQRQLDAVQRELADERKQGELRDAAQPHLADARAARVQKDWGRMERSASEALAAVGTESALADLRTQADELKTEALAGLDARKRYQQFQHHREDALYHATLFAGPDPGPDLAASAAAVREGLGLFGVRPETPGPPTILELYFSDQERADLAGGCYELLLILAHTLAHPVPGQPREERQARLEQAVRVLDGAAKLGLDSRTFHLQRAQCLEGLDRKKEARQEQDRAARLEPATARDFLLSGIEKHQRGRPDLAIPDLEQAVQRDGRLLSVQYYLAVCYFQANRLGEARAFLDAFLKQRQDLAWAYVVRGLIHLKLGEHAQVAEATGHYAAAEADFRAALDRHPDESVRWAVCINRGVLRLQQNRLDEAVTEFQEALRLQPDRELAHVSLAQAHRKQKKLDEALAQLNQAIDSQPLSPVLYRERAQLHLDRHDQKAALADLDLAVNLLPPADRSPALAEDHVQRGWLLYRGRRYAEAVEACDAALGIQPGHATAHRWRAAALLELAEAEPAARRHELYGEVERSCERYLKSGKPDAGVYRTRARARAAQDNYAGARDDYTSALSLAPDAATYIARGWVYLLRIDAPKLALSDFEAALHLDPEHAEAYAGRGAAHMKAGLYRAAIADADKAVALKPEAAKLLYYAARIYAQAVLKVEADTKQPGRPARVVERRAFEKRAVDLLRQALEQTPAEEREAFWRDLVHAEMVFRPLWGIPMFQALERRFSRSMK